MVKRSENKVEGNGRGEISTPLRAPVISGQMHTFSGKNDGRKGDHRKSVKEKRKKKKTMNKEVAKMMKWSQKMKTRKSEGRKKKLN